MPLPLQQSLEQFLQKTHLFPEYLEGRNVMAGYARITALQYDSATPFITKDPLYSSCKALIEGRQFISETRLMNLFLILKYGLKNLEGDILEFGTYRGGTAFFLAAAARALGLKTTIYALDTFEGMPALGTKLDFHHEKNFYHVSLEELLEYQRQLDLTNLVFVKGCFEKTASHLLTKSQRIILAHIDCDLYQSTHEAITTTLPHLHPEGGYLVFDDALQGTCLGALQAVEEMIQQHHLRAEQSFPHLVYRYPKVN